jgi:E2/UBC family protein E
MIPQELQDEVSRLRDLGFTVDIEEEGQRIYLIFRNFPLGLAYAPSVSNMMVFTSVQYPNAGFDMFWVDEGVKLAGGGNPQAGDSIETYLGRRWRRFSWHLPSDRPWNPKRDSLSSWLAAIEERLRKGV